jgi:RNA polymerase sigma-70 factor (ECF subfamily)
LEELNKIWSEVKKGNEKAFYSLYTLLFPNLVKYVRQIVKDGFLAEDIVQEMFIKIWRDRNSLNIIGQVQAYIYKIAHHSSINKLQHFATSKNKVNRMVSDEEWLFIRDTYQMDELIIENIECDDMDRLIRKTIDTLPAKCREVFILSRYEYQNNEEIAQKLGISVHTVRVHIYHALEVIRHSLKIEQKNLLHD